MRSKTGACLVTVCICGESVLFKLDPSVSGISFAFIVTSHTSFIDCVRPVS